MNTEEIRKVNDAMRRMLPVSTNTRRVVCTRAVAQARHFAEIVEAVRNFTAFDQGNDPYGEHDFGIVVVAGTKYCFKFSYYDAALELHGYEVFVMTIMELQEY